MGSRVRASVLAIACVVALGLSATAAKAGLLDGLGGILDQILDGGTDIDPDLGDELAALLCDPSSDLAEGIEDGALSALPADVIPALTCNLGLLDYKFQTTLKRSNGTEVVRTHNALVQIPRPLNVDDDIAPDLIGTIGLSGAGRFTLRVNRMLGENAALPTKVEAIISAPSGVDIGRDTIAFGYDTTTSKAPKTFNSGISLLSLIGPGGPGIKFQTDVTGAGPSLALVGELFDKGPGGERRSPMRARVGFTPVPATMTATVDLGNPLLATVTTSQRSKVDVLGQLISTPATGPATEKRIDAVIDSLPSTVNVSYLSGGEFQRTVTYDASDPIGRIDVTYTEKIGTAIDQKAVVTVKDLPKGLVVNQTGKVDADMHTTQGVIGEVYGSFANGEPQAAPTAPGANVITSGDYSSVGFRAGGIEALDVHGAAPYTLDATLARQRFGVFIDDRDEARTIDARVNSLPHELHLELDPDAGHVVFDGFGEAIDEITLDADDDDPFFADATEITGAIRGLPTFLDVNFAQDKETGITVSANEGPREIEVLASDGSALALPPGEAGAVYRDTADQYAVFARVFGLKSVAVDPDPLHAVIETNRGGDFSVDARLETVDPRFNQLSDVKTIDGTLTGLPERVEVTYTEGGPDVRHVTYDGRGTLDGIDLTYEDLDPRRDEVDTKVLLGVDDLPEKLTIDQTGPKAATLSASSPVTRIEGAIANGEPLLPQGDAPGMRLRTTGEPEDPDHFSSIGFRIDGFESASLDGAGPYVIDAVLGSPTFKAVIEEPEEARTITANLGGLPRHFSADIDPEAGGPPIKAGLDRPVAIYDGFGDEIGSADLIATDDRGPDEALDEDGLGDLVRRLEAFVDGIPSKVEVDYVITKPEEEEPAGEESTEIEFLAEGGVDSMEALAIAGFTTARTREELTSSHPTLPFPVEQEAIIDDPTRAGVVFNDTGPLVAFARIFGLSEVDVTTDPLHVHTSASADQKLEVIVRDEDDEDVTSDPLVSTIDATVDPLPADLTLDMTTDPASEETVIDYEASSRIAELALETHNIGDIADVSGQAHRLAKIAARGVLSDVPADVEVTIGGPKCAGSLTIDCGNVVDVDLGEEDDEERLGLLEFQIVEEGHAFAETKEDDHDGAAFRSIPDEPFSAFARLHEFRNLDVSNAPTQTSLDLDVDDAEPFDYELRLPDATDNGPTHPPVISGTIDEPQSLTTLALRPQADRMTIDYNSSSSITGLSFFIGERAVDGPDLKTLFDINLASIPSRLDACVGIPSNCEAAGFSTSRIGESHNVDAIGVFLDSNALNTREIEVDGYACVIQASLGCDGELWLDHIRFADLGFEILIDRDGYMFADTLNRLVTGSAVFTLRKRNDPEEFREFSAVLGGGMQVSRRLFDIGSAVPGFEGENTALCADDLDFDALGLGNVVARNFCTGDLP